jgi:hypothetical protein
MRFLACVSVLALLAATPGSAHHWFNASYESGTIIELTGVVTRFDWKNPHALFYMDVVDTRGGQSKNWLMEMGSPNSLARADWSKTSLKPGEKVIVEIIPARDGVAMGYPLVVTVVETGRRLVAAPRP